MADVPQPDTTNIDAQAAAQGMQQQIPPQLMQQMQQAQQQQAGLQAPNLRDQMMPNVARFISQMIRPTAQVQPGQTADQLRPPSRLDAFENFLGTFMEAFAQGMQHGGSGPGANARGFGAAMLAPQNQAIQQFGLNQQAQQGQQGAAQGQAQLAQTQAQTAAIPQAIQEKLQAAQIGAGAQVEKAAITGQATQGAAAKRAGGLVTAAGITAASKERIAAGSNLSRETIAKATINARMAMAASKDALTRDIAAQKLAVANDPNKLTPQMKSMKEQATALLPEINRIEPMIDQVSAKLGPAAGRWNDFWQGKVGGKDPDFARLKDETGFLETGIALAHARGRMSNIVFEHFQRMFEAGKQDPANMHAAMQTARQWMTDYSHLGEGGGGATPAVGGGQGNYSPSNPFAPKQ